jgi:hypothetical protein
LHQPKSETATNTYLPTETILPWRAGMPDAKNVAAEVILQWRAGVKETNIFNGRSAAKIGLKGTGAVAALLQLWAIRCFSSIRCGAIMSAIRHLDSKVRALCANGQEHRSQLLH